MDAGTVRRIPQATGCLFSSHNSWQRLQAPEQPVPGVLTHSRERGRHERGLFPEPPPSPRAGKGSGLHLGQGSACYSVPALTQMAQQLCQPPPKPPRTFCTQTAFERPWQQPGSAGALPSRGKQRQNRARACGAKGHAHLRRTAARSSGCNRPCTCRSGSSRTWAGRAASSRRC